MALPIVMSSRFLLLALLAGGRRACGRRRRLRRRRRRLPRSSSFSVLVVVLNHLCSFLRPLQGFASPFFRSGSAPSRAWRWPARRPRPALPAPASSASLCICSSRPSTPAKLETRHQRPQGTRGVRPADRSRPSISARATASRTSAGAGVQPGRHVQAFAGCRRSQRDPAQAGCSPGRSSSSDHAPGLGLAAQQLGVGDQQHHGLELLARRLAPLRRRGRARRAAGRRRCAARCAGWSAAALEQRAHHLLPSDRPSALASRPA